MTELLEKINEVVWGPPTLALILGVGLYLSVRTGFVQLRLLPEALRAFWAKLRNKDTSSGVSSYQALCTALAATVGTGNIAGVAGAIAIGGPGAIFWMWISALIGMGTKFAEVVLAVRYRQKNEAGEWLGGPMYMIQKGMGKKWTWLAGIYCFFGVVAAFGVGNATQINAVIDGANSVIRFCGGETSRIIDLFIGIILAFLICMILLGGARRIGTIAEGLVPFAALVYILMCIGVLAGRCQMIPDVLRSIVICAFSPQAMTGGAVGSCFVALRIGASRGVFTNEAGMGTAAIAHSAADVKDPIEQGLMGIMEVFLDTIVICTLTALVILCSGVDIHYGADEGAALTLRAFSSFYGEWIAVPMAIALCCFAIATVLGWGLYGARCAQFLFGENVWQRFVLIQGGAVVLGAVLNTQTVWLLSETVNGLMAIPNLMALAALCPELSRLVKHRSSKCCSGVKRIGLIGGQRQGSNAAAGGIVESDLVRGSR